MKLLLSAFIGSHNLGDEAIAKVLISRLEKEDDITLNVLSIDPAKTKKICSKDSTFVAKAGFINFFKLLRSSDALVLGGGGIIQDESSVVNLLYYQLQAAVAKTFAKKPVYLLFVGVGPIKSRFGKFLLKKLSRSVKYSLVRDKESAQLLKDHGFAEENILTAYDIVFNMPPSKIANIKENCVLFCPRDWFFVRTYIPTKFALRLARRSPNSGLNVYRNHLLKTVSGFLQANPQVNMLGVALFYTQDKNLLEWIRANLPAEHKKRFAVELNEITPEEFFGYARSARAVIGVRLHSLIIAAAAEKPLAPIVYSAKVESLINYLGLREYTTYLDRPDFDSAEAVKRINQALKDQANYKPKLQDIKAKNESSLSLFLSEIKKAG